MEELIPILLQYVKSRQKPGGYVVFVAHNARAFDVPFLINEFSRCHFEIPPNWLFVDTLPLAREVIKLECTLPLSGVHLLDALIFCTRILGVTESFAVFCPIGSKLNSGTSLEALRKKYNISLVGNAHRALCDVTASSLVLQRLTFDLKLPLSGLVAKHFKASDLNNVKKKNSR